jgi:hypothetical protein
VAALVAIGLLASSIIEDATAGLLIFSMTLPPIAQGGIQSIGMTGAGHRVRICCEYFKHPALTTAHQYFGRFRKADQIPDRLPQYWLAIGGSQ